MTKLKKINVILTAAGVGHLTHLSWLDFFSVKKTSAVYQKWSVSRIIIIVARRMREAVQEESGAGILCRHKWPRQCTCARVSQVRIRRVNAVEPTATARRRTLNSTARSAVPCEVKENCQNGLFFNFLFFRTLSGTVIFGEP